MEGNKEKKDFGQLLDSSINQGLFAFNPDMMFDQLANDFNNAEQIYGETMLRALTGYDPNALKKNLRFPEFKRDLKSKIEDKFEELKKQGLLNYDNEITEKGFELAALTLYMEELDDLTAKGLGEKIFKKSSHYGEKNTTKNFKKNDRYKDLALKKSIKKAIRRNHKELELQDLQVFERESKGKINLIYGLDASGSMKGKKLSMCKKAGIALAFKAINAMDKVGLIVFGSEIEDTVHPTTDFSLFLKSITKVRAKQQTDIASTIKKAIEMFTTENITKHLILITDAVPTVGDNPNEDTLNLVSQATSVGITISVIGIGLDKDGEDLAKKIVEIGNGKLYVIKDLENLDKIVLEDYYSLT